MNETNIENKVDLLIRSRAGKHTRKILKPLFVGVVLLVGASLVLGGLMFYSIRVETDFTTDYIFNWDGQNAETLLFTRTIPNVVGGNVYSFTHWINASNFIQDSVTLVFDFTGNITDGITPSIVFDGNSTTELILVPGGFYEITEVYICDPMLTMENYNIDLMLTIE